MSDKILKERFRKVSVASQWLGFLKWKRMPQDKGVQ